MNQFPPSISIEVNSTTPEIEIMEIAINEAFSATHFKNFRLECIIAGTMEWGTTLISYDVIKQPELDVKKLLYSKWW